MSAPLKLRPRDGKPDHAYEHIAQALWKWRSELALAYILGAITFAVLVQIGWL